MASIIIKPLVTEKSQNLASQDKYVFVVSKKANKVQIAKEIKNLYNVNVLNVNTSVMPGTAVSRSTKTAVVKGVKPSYKKAIVTLAAGETLDIFTGGVQ